MDLIDLDSPSSNNLNSNYVTRSPLVPCPKFCGNIELQNNPFDSVVNAVEINQQPDDPFDLVALSSKINKYIRNSVSTSNSQADLTQNLSEQSKLFKRSFSSGIIKPSNRSSVSQEISTNTSNGNLNTSLPLNAEYSPFAEDTSYEMNYDSFEMTKKQLREEAEKLSALVKNASKTQDSSSSDDLLDIEPPWECDDVVLSGEEDSIGLPKLKTYGNRGGTTNFGRPIIEKHLIEKYMKKRLSLDMELKKEIEKDQEANTSECFAAENTVVSSSLLEDLEPACPGDSKPEEVVKYTGDIQECKKLEAPLVNNMLEKQSLRPKKKTANNITKKGPMKAFVPLQNMSKNITAKIMPPLKNIAQLSFKKVDTKEEKKIKPIASSTPNQSPLSSPAKVESRSRDNKKMSPTSRKAIRRSTSAGGTTVQNITTRVKHPPTLIEAKVSKNISTGKILTRPESAPTSGSDGHVQRDIKIATLKALKPRPLNRVTRTSVTNKVISKSKQPTTKSTQDKENQV